MKEMPEPKAVASVSGVMLDCTGPTNHPMPVVHLHGTSDGVLPYNGNNDWNSAKSTKTRTLLDTQSNKFQRTCITITPDLFL